jgi:CHASE1-domain containing sensor protein
MRSAVITGLALLVAVLVVAKYYSPKEGFQAHPDQNMILYIALGGAAIAFVAFVVAGGVHHARRVRYSP